MMMELSGDDKKFGLLRRKLISDYQLGWRLFIKASMPSIVSLSIMLHAILSAAYS